MKKFNIGIDIGGTNTDIVLIDEQDNIIFSCKMITTDPIDAGVETVMTQLFKNTEITPDQITGVFIGSTHAVNVILRRKDLFKVGVIRISGKSGACIESCFGWPQDLKNAVFAGAEIVDGGYYCDAREISPLNKKQVMRSIKKISAAGAESFAVIGVYSPLNNAQELQVAKLIKEQLGVETSVCISSEVGGTGFVERENAAILNAALKKCIQKGFSKLKNIVQKYGLACPIFITQNNGTIIDIADALEFPILTISAGPTNSFVGASKLADLQDAVIADIGGTSTDVGIVLDGFARRSLESTDIGGISLNFPMPDVLSVGIGGGSYITVNQNGDITIGPDSAGRNLKKEAQCFGGDALTLTDIAVCKKIITIEGADPNKVSCDQKIMPQVVDMVKEKLLSLKKIIAGKKHQVPLVLVGGGASLFKNSEIADICIIPDNADVANAYGAALAEISGIVDTVVNIDNRQEVLEKLIEQAKENAIQNGAKKETLRVVDKQVIPFSYVPGNLARVKITVVGKRSSRM